jgi:hypothetical protein
MTLRSPNTEFDHIEPRTPISLVAARLDGARVNPYAPFHLANCMGVFVPVKLNVGIGLQRRFNFFVIAHPIRRMMAQDEVYAVRPPFVMQLDISKHHSPRFHVILRVRHET